MTVSDDERREVAARLRDMAPGSDWPKYVAEACGMDVSKMSNHFHTYTAQLCQRLADLIEPEPERTCRVVTDKNAVSQTQEVHTKYCSECSYVFGREQHRQLLPGLDEEYVLHAVQIPNYCPNCGAKVVEK